MSDYQYDVPGDFAAAVRFQQAYQAMAFLLYGIEIGKPIIVTGDQDSSSARPLSST